MAKISTTTTFIPIVLLLCFAPAFLADSVVDERVKGECGVTAYPELCVSTLLRYTGSTKTYANGKELAELEVLAASRLLSLASTAAGSEHWNDENMSKEDEDCFKECKEKLHGAVRVLNPYPDKMKLADVRSFLDEAKAKNLEWNCDACRHGDGKKRVDEISKGNKAEKFMEILPLLLHKTLDNK
jgi:pectinesterase inhibitor-like protein